MVSSNLLEVLAQTAMTVARSILAVIFVVDGFVYLVDLVDGFGCLVDLVPVLFVNA